MPLVVDATRRAGPGRRRSLSLTRGLALVSAALFLPGCTPDAGQPPEPSEAVATDPVAVHPAFTITADDLADLVAGESPATREAVADRPEVFLDLAREILPLEAPVLAVVDKESGLPADYEPADLVPLTRYGDRLILNRDGLSLRAPIIPDLIAMVEAARLDGILLDISSTYRSYAYQENLFAYWVDQLGREEAERVSARAGTSQHQLGTTLDFGSVTTAFAEEPAGIWLRDHAHRFGFSLSYPDGYEEVTGYAWEPWHFRWLSRPALRMEREFFSGIQQHFLEFWREAETPLRSACTTCS
jgi:zinc D-Ala-D-Ala carboxypeptidase